MAKKTYVVVGTGGRATMYIEAILKTYPDSCRLAGFCDVNQGRMDFYNEELQSKYNVEPVATYLADQFDRMIEEQKPDVVIVTSMDSTHDIYITRAMELGCDGVLMNTAIAKAKDPVRMARAMKLAVQAGRDAYLAGRMAKKLYADPSSPLGGLI